MPRIFFVCIHAAKILLFLLACCKQAVYNFQDNMNAGLKVEGADHTGCGCHGDKIVLLSATYDSYFHSAGKRSSRFIGAGLGYYFGKNYGLDEQTKYYNNPTCFIRFGYEIRKFRISLSCNLLMIPKDINPYQNNNSLEYGILSWRRRMEIKID